MITVKLKHWHYEDISDIVREIAKATNTNFKMTEDYVAEGMLPSNQHSLTSEVGQIVNCAAIQGYDVMMHVNDSGIYQIFICRKGDFFRQR